MLFNRKKYNKNLISIKKYDADYMKELTDRMKEIRKKMENSTKTQTN